MRPRDSLLAGGLGAVRAAVRDAGDAARAGAGRLGTWLPPTVPLAAFAAAVALWQAGDARGLAGLLAVAGAVLLVRGPPRRRGVR
ncbi:MAG: hypothetical protein ABEJ42_02085 [Halobacteriaceae archaeon]